MKTIVLNQVSGVLFFDICNSLNKDPSRNIELHSEPIDSKLNLDEGVQFFPAPKYSRKNYLSKIISWFKFCFYASKIYLSSADDDEILISSNPPMLLGFFYFLNFFRKREFSIIVYDLYPEIVVDLGVLSSGNFLVKLWAFINEKAFFHSKKIYIVTRKMREILISKYSINSEKINLLSIWVDVEKYKPIPTSKNNLIKKLNAEEKLVITYAGNFGKSHDHMTFFNAIKKINNRPDVIFIISGGGEKLIRAQKFVDENNIKNVKFLGYQEEALYQQLLSMSDISIVSQAKGTENSMIPSKTYYAMSCECAIFCITALNSELCNLITIAKCGKCFKQGDYDALADEIVNCLKSKEVLLYAKRARKYIMENHNKQKILTDFSL